MPVFWFLVIVAIIGIWFLCAFLYKPLGRLFKRIFKDSYDAANKEDAKDFNIIDKE